MLSGFAALLCAKALPFRQGGKPLIPLLVSFCRTGKASLSAQQSGGATGCDASKHSARTASGVHDGKTMLRLEDETRQELWRRLTDTIESYATQVDEARVTPELDPDKLRSLLAPYDFSRPVDPLAAFDFVVQGLWQHQTHTPHRRYFGLFNPAPTTMGIAADTLVAAFNPQLAAWSHSPLAVEIEQHVIRSLGARFGYDPASTDGAFTSGGAEANHTAVLTALTRVFPGFASAGVRALDGQPTIYVSTESHHSFLKAARFCGLGTGAVVEIPVDAHLAMNVE